MDYLYGGKILIIDLTEKKITKEPSSSYITKFIGARGINGKIMYDLISPGIHPLDPENIIVFGVGPLTGTFCPGSSRVDVMAKSPVTGFLGNSNMGGYWPAELKYAGFDHLIIKGKADHPVYISIDNDEVRILDASNLWGKDTYLTPNIICEELKDPETKVICIGKAGENKVTFSSILSNFKNAAGRTGMGAIMGSKNLKAIAVRGTKGVRLADPEGFFICAGKLHNLIKNAPSYEEYSKRGSTNTMYLSGIIGYTPAGNQQIFDWDPKEKFITFWEKYGVKRAGCFNCPVQCADTYDVPGIGCGSVSCQSYVDPTWKIKNDNLLVWWECVRSCQLYGIDVISVTGILAWLMELYEKGIISKDDTDGIAMDWGNRDAIIKMINRIVNREGIGDILAEGFKEAIKHFGKESENYAMHVKNSPLYIQSPRYPFIGLGDALGARGDYLRAYVPLTKGVLRALLNPELSTGERAKIMEKYENEAEKISGTKKAASLVGYEGKPKALIYGETMVSIPDMLGVCKHLGISNFQILNPNNLAEVLSLGLGKTVSSEELITVAHRIRNVERAFDAREGLTRKDDTIPEREFNKDIGGRHKGICVNKDDFEKAKDEYYQLRGWNVETGIPAQKTLVDLGLHDIAEDLKKYKKITDS
jgi:aldehyde:ferredoxin oxidoreductase